MRIIHCCEECGNEITGDYCEEHPDASIDSVVVEDRFWYVCKGCGADVAVYDQAEAERMEYLCLNCSLQFINPEDLPF